MAWQEAAWISHALLIEIVRKEFRRRCGLASHLEDGVARAIEQKGAGTGGFLVASRFVVGTA